MPNAGSVITHRIQPAVGSAVPFPTRTGVSATRVVPRRSAVTRQEPRPATLVVHPDHGGGAARHLATDHTDPTVGDNPHPRVELGKR
ncbi:hypothetical protein GCM10012279_54440 [Micromonospora yangpuensis]|nr:hypothetical protein GCM10012279_54440 [Micromonospora yangpuensis]